MKDIAYSPAAASDIDDLLNIENESFQSPWPREHFQNELTQPHSFILLARQPEMGRIAGYIIYWFIVDELHILNIAVSPTVRRQGVARGLIGEVIRRAKIKDLKTAWLEVRTSNKEALALYHSLGFKLIMTRKRYYRDTGEDALILSRSL